MHDAKRSIKLVVAGPVGVGKTTAIAAIADGEPLSTEMPFADAGHPGKSTTTVALDFSAVELDPDTDLHVYGLPGQDHFDFMRPIVLSGADGVVVLLDARESDLEGVCTRWLEDVRAHAPSAGLVIGITHVDQARGFSLSRARAAVRGTGDPIPVQTLDARDAAQVRQLMRILVAAATS
jgi:signal recognition particle receptor subunit beta